MPQWAIDRTVVLLRIGLRVPEIVKKLAAQGLSTEAATEIVNRVLEDRVRQEMGPQEQAERQNHWHRVLSGFVGGVNVLHAYWFFGSWGACIALRNTLLPLACIWFPDWMRGASHSALVSPVGLFIRWGGWLLLVLLAIDKVAQILVTAS